MSFLGNTDIFFITRSTEINIFDTSFDYTANIIQTVAKIMLKRVSFDCVK